MKSVLRTVLIVILVELTGGLLFAVSGIYNVAATNYHSAPVKWFLSTVSDRSIASRSKDIQAPDLSNPQSIKEGFGHYNEMCVQCHGAPGVDRSETGAGLNPRPPNLYSSKAGNPSTIFWVVKNGIKMTGMPAYGPTHTDDKLWAIVAFVKHLSQMSPDEYAAFAAAGGATHGKTGTAD